MKSVAWNPSQYLKFAESRLRPAADLLARVTLAAPRNIYDLGCGTGNATRMIKARWPEAAVTGVDNSAEMLAQAAQDSGEISWQQLNLADWDPEHPADLIFSNAALHWLPNHAQLFPTLMAKLAAGGMLAVQMPRNFNSPSHTLIVETVQNGPWHARLAHLLGPPPVGEPQHYYALLEPHASRIEIWETEYLEVLEGANPVKEWLKGTWLKPFLDQLDPTERPAFEANYAHRVSQAYPKRPDGKTLFPFKRLFLVVQKAAR
ncbi:MAG: methyltransferase domain-containing protein [Sterolibacterium sp.]